MVVVKGRSRTTYIIIPKKEQPQVFLIPPMFEFQIQSQGSVARDLQLPSCPNPNYQCKDSVPSTADQKMRQLTCRTKNSFQESQANEVNSYGSPFSSTSCSCHLRTKPQFLSSTPEQRLKESAQVAEMAQWVKYLLLKCEDLYSNSQNMLKPGV